MTPGEVVIAGPQWNGEITEPGVWSFWYFGADYSRFLSVRANLGQGHVIVPVGEVVNQVAGRLQKPFLELEQHATSGRFAMAWMCSDLAERNPMSSDFFLDVCRAVGLVEAARSGGGHFVYVEDSGFAKALAKVCRMAGLRVRTRIAHSAASTVVRAIRSHGGFIRDWIRQRLALRRYVVEISPLRGCDTLLLSWVGAADANRQPTDRYFGSLPVWLRTRGIKIGWLGNPTTWIDPAEKIAAAVQATSSKEPMALVGVFQGSGALLRGYANLLTLPFAMGRHFVVAGIELRALVQLFVRREIMSPRLVLASLYSTVAAGLRRRGITPARLLYTYENQPWEKAMLAGFRRVSPEMKLIGVQHAPFAENYLSARPTAGQWSDGTAPDQLVIIGDEFRTLLLKDGAPAGRIVTGGALRFPDLVKDIRAVKKLPSGAPVRILVSCSMDPQESFELVHKAAAATSDLQNVQVLVNFHPMFEEGLRVDVRTRTVALMDMQHVEFVEGQAQQWLSQVDIVLYSSSGTSFEATAQGIPVVFVESELSLDLDKMAGQSGARGRNARELRRVIDRLKSDEVLRRTCVESAQAFLRRCFVTPDPVFWIPLVGQHASTARI